MKSIAIILALFFAAAFAQHPYPRTAIFQWSGAPDEWYARFDVVMTRNDSPDWGRRVKALNPSAILLPAKDWNKGNEIDGFRSEWFAVTSKGARINLYGSDSWFSDLSDICHRVNGKRYIDFLVDYLAAQDRTVFNGVATDGIYGTEHLTWNMFADIDLDRNGQNDLTESGKGKSWVIYHWQAGIDYLLAELRRRLGSNQIILLNSGTTHGWGWEQTNGMVSEHTSGVFDPNFFFTTYRNLMNRAYKPVVSLMNSNPEGRDNERARPSKNYYRHMRFMLGVAMCFDWYFEYEDLESGEHYYNQFYDEFLIKVGYPRSDVHRIKGNVWVRFFDSGAIIANVNNANVSITDADLRGLTGYGGPYFRFRGGQAPAINNGQAFTQVNLLGHNVVAYGGNNMIVGDGLLLVKSPRTAVADIILDESPGSTTAGGADAEFVGNWTKKCDGGFGFYTLRCASWMNLFGYAVSGAFEDAVATYRPNIGLSGKYEVFEWHGQLGNNHNAVQENPAVRHVIKHAGGESAVIVNQRINYGKWNSLGIFQFNAGNDNQVRIINDAGGQTIADAVKFVYKDSQADITPPAAPKNVRIESF